MRVVLLTAIVLTICPAQAADGNDWFNVKPVVHGKTAYYDFNEPLRRFEREQNAHAMAGVKGDAHFEQFFKSAVWYPPARQRRSVALGGPYEASWMYGAAVAAQRKLDRKPPEPLPESMRVHLARRYVKFKEKLADQRAQGFQSEEGSGTGRFKLSTTMTDVQMARTELAELAGFEAVEKLERELNPNLRAKLPPPPAVPKKYVDPFEPEN